MNGEEFRKISHCGEIPKDFWFYRNKAVKYFNLQKGEVIHHLFETKEQQDFNNSFYERWGFDFDGQMKYCVKMKKEDHDKYHSNLLKGKPKTDEHKQKISNSVKAFWSTPEGKEKSKIAREKQWSHESMRTTRTKKLQEYNKRPDIIKKKQEIAKGSFIWTNGERNTQSKECPGEGWYRGVTYKDGGTSPYRHMKVLHKNTGILYNSIEEAVEATGYSRKFIVSRCTWKIPKTEKGQSFQFIHPEEDSENDS